MTHRCDDDFEIKIGIFEISQLLKLDMVTRAEDLCDLSKGILCESFEQDRRLNHPYDDDFYFLRN